MLLFNDDYLSCKKDTTAKWWGRNSYIASPMKQSWRASTRFPLSSGTNTCYPVLPISSLSPPQVSSRPTTDVLLLVRYVKRKIKTPG